MTAHLCESTHSTTKVVCNISQLLAQLIHCGRVSQSNPEPTDMTTLTRQLALKIPCVCFLSLKLQMCHHTHPAFTWILRI